MKFETTNITNHPSAKSSILLIYTGGTFGMVYDQSGSLAPFNFSLVLEKVPELRTLDLNLTVISFPNPVDSSNIKSSHWGHIAQIVYNNYKQYDGFVVLHGTDTMAFSASALSFMFDGLNKPVIFTGAQIPIGATRSDARENLITAIEMACEQRNGRPLISEVCLYFNFVLLRGNRAQKIRSSTFGAFESENYPHLARSGVDIQYYENYLYRPDGKQVLSFSDKFDLRVSILKIFPNITEEVVNAVLHKSHLKGLILESYGSGNTMKEGWFLESLQTAIKNGLIVLNVSQCIGGSVNQGKYETSKMLSEIGVLSGYDITTEAAVTKMMFLLGNESSSEIVKSLLIKPLRGEMAV